MASQTMMLKFLIVENITTKENLIPLKQKIRKIAIETIAQFRCLLENETWEPVCKNKDINHKFNAFLYTFLNIFEASFPFQNKRVGSIKNDWIALGIKTSCKHKRCLYIHCRSRNNPNMRACYIKYCKILSRFIKKAKGQHYCRLIAKSDTQIKTTCNIIKHEAGKLHLMEQIPSLLIKEKK
jgi:hypothetical protein